MSKPFLQKEEYTKEDIHDFIDSYTSENYLFDLKRKEGLSKSKKGDICKDVSAFANTRGGIIIYGIGEDKENDTIFLDAFHKSYFSIQSLEQIIIGGISKPILGVRYFAIEMEEGKFIYLVKIPESEDSPHMALKNKKYYIRYEETSQAIEEHLVRSLYFKSVSVDLNLDLKFSLHSARKNNKPQDGKPKINEVVILLSIKVENIGKVIANNFRIVAKISESLINRRNYFGYKNELWNHLKRKDDSIIEFEINHQMPIYQSEKLLLIENHLDFGYLSYNNYLSNKISFELYFNGGNVKIEKNLHQFLKDSNLKTYEQSEFYDPTRID